MPQMKATIEKKSKHSPNIFSSCSCNIMGILVCCNLLGLCCGIEKSKKGVSCNFFSGVFGYFKRFFSPGFFLRVPQHRAPERKPSYHNHSFSCQPSATLRPELCQLCRVMGVVFFGVALKNSMCDDLMRGHSMGLYALMFHHSQCEHWRLATRCRTSLALYGSDPCVSTPCEYFPVVTLWWCCGVFVVVFCGVVVSLLWCFCVHLERLHMDCSEKWSHMVFSHRTSTHRVVTFAKSAPITKNYRTSPCNAPANKRHSTLVLSSALLYCNETALV